MGYQELKLKGKLQVDWRELKRMQNISHKRKFFNGKISRANMCSYVDVNVCVHYGRWRQIHWNSSSDRKVSFPL